MFNVYTSFDFTNFFFVRFLSEIVQLLLDIGNDVELFNDLLRVYKLSIISIISLIIRH